MKKIITLLFIILGFSFTLQVDAAFWNKKQKPILIITPKNPQLDLDYDEKLLNYEVFRTNQKIYFIIYVPEGFKSDYIRYQIVKQDDNAHIGGYTRIRNITKKVSDKKHFMDYFLITQPGKYYLQVFDITNLHQWLAIGAFGVVNE